MPGFNNSTLPMDQATFDAAASIMRKVDAAILELAPASNAAWLSRANMGASSAKLNRALGLLKEVSNELEARIRNN